MKGQNPKYYNLILCSLINPKKKKKKKVESPRIRTKVWLQKILILC